MSLNYDITSRDWDNTDVNVNITDPDGFNGIKDLDNDNASFSEGTLTDVEVVNDGLELGKLLNIYDTFEDSNQPYTEGGSNVVRSVATSYSGSYSLKFTNNQSYQQQTRTETTPNKFKFEGWVYTSTGVSNTGLTGLCFNVPDPSTKNGYQAVIDTRSRVNYQFMIRKDYSSLNILAGDTLTVSNGNWYKIKIEFDNGNITAYLYDDLENLLSTISTTDNTYSSGNFGVACFETSYFDNIRLLNYLTQGTRKSPQLNLSAVGSVESSSISWQETLNSQTITVETSVDGGSTWQTATNGGAIPNLPADPTTLDVRQTLNTCLLYTSPSPRDS